MLRMLVIALAASVFVFSPAQVQPVAAKTAISACGSVSSDSILASDLTSTGTCLTFTASNITLDLDGHSITNTNSRPVTTPCGTIDYKGQSTRAAGIDTNGQSVLLIKGPGTISGYHHGVFINGGSLVNVRDLRVTGTPAPVSSPTGLTIPGCNPRPDSSGIAAMGTVGVNIHGNTVENQTEGIELANVSTIGGVGGNVGHNVVRRNNSDPTECHGIKAVNTSLLNFNNNEVTLNGESLSTDGGLTLEGISAANNTVVHNTVNNNFGDGISVRSGAHDNQIVNNTALGNPAALNPTDPGLTFFDLAQRSAGTDNKFVNNTFGTKNF